MSGIIDLVSVEFGEVNVLVSPRSVLILVGLLLLLLTVLSI